MNKLMIAAAAALFAVASFFATGAEAAGFNLRLDAPKGLSNIQKTGCGRHRRAFRRHAIQSVRRAAKRRSYVAEKRVVVKKKIYVAKTKPVEKIEEPVETAAVEKENSSIATDKDNVAVAPTPEKKEKQVAAVAKDLGCKQFFPSVGMTLSVPCE